jgi:hypothetical protein
MYVEIYVLVYNLPSLVFFQECLFLTIKKTKKILKKKKKNFSNKKIIIEDNLK